MYKYIMILLSAVIMISFSSCSDEDYIRTYSKPVIVLPDEETAYTVNGYKDTTYSSVISQSEENSSESVTSEYAGRYIGNKNSKKLHKTTCSYAKKLNESNIEIFESISEAELDGYTLCSRCMD